MLNSPKVRKYNQNGKNSFGYFSRENTTWIIYNADGRRLKGAR